ncbi:CpaF family protein [Agreia sp. Leaf210]|uniref:CpaF family protein n=1 Tax=Agreia sp. Leaf210 TaxID=1735682 RepID=UPI0009E7F1B3|nr:ATPase, T2SS/T4P/T4SS family [Agreia sp. Leaf210]
MASRQLTDDRPGEAAREREPFVAAPVLSAPPAVPAPPSPTAGAGTHPSSTQRSSPVPRSRAGASDFGPLAGYVSDPDVTDVFVNGPDDLWIDRGTGLVRQPGWSCPSEVKLRELAVAIVARGGRHIDEATPCADVRLHDGIRVHVALPPIAPRGTLLSIRIPPLDRPRLDSLAASGLFGEGAESQGARTFIDEAVRSRANLLITGAGGSGKTTFLSALLAAADRADRIIAVEDVAELRVEHPHFIALETRQPNLEGAGGVGLDRLLREALRMRPDRLVLGECRGGEIRELLSALNTGHDGGAGTLHANSLDDVPARLEALGSLAAMSPETVARQAVSAIGLVLHLERRGSRRVLDAVGRFGIDAAGRLRVEAIE